MDVPLRWQRCGVYRSNEALDLLETLSISTRGCKDWLDRLDRLSKETDLGVVTEGIINLHLVGAFEVNKSCFEALVFLRYTGHVTESAAINIVNADDVCVVAEGLKDRGGRGRTRCKGEGVGTAGFER
jgi:hypothetical protein